MQADAVPLTEELIENLVTDGWDRDDLAKKAKEDMRYSPSRNSLLAPRVSG